MEGRSKQLRHLDEAMKYVNNWRLAIDVGAHGGHWSLKMSERFESVVAFEPMEKPAQRWRERMAGRRNASLHKMAIADRRGRAVLVAGSTKGLRAKPHIRYADNGPVEVSTIDHFAFKSVDLIKIDVEGADAMVLLGAAETISRDRPVVIIENISEFQAIYGKNRVPKIMSRFGAKLVAEIFPDQIWVFD